MTYRSTVLLLCPAAIAGVAAWLRALKWQSQSTAVLREIRKSAKESVAETRALHRTLRRQRGAINDIHRYLVPVSKGVDSLCANSSATLRSSYTCSAQLHTWPLLITRDDLMECAAKSISESAITIAGALPRVIG
jgi:hypothetical protein